MFAPVTATKSFFEVILFGEHHQSLLVVIKINSFCQLFLHLVILLMLRLYWVMGLKVN